jgi:hemolysin III
MREILIRTNNTSIIEEIFNSTTHGVGIVLGIAAIYILLPPAIQTHNIRGIIGVSVFGVTLILMYLTSTIYHGFFFTKARKSLRIIDHSAIFIFIAGTYTPFVLTYLNGSIKTTILVLVWLAALGGIFFNIFHIDKSRLSLVLYLVFGLAALLILKPLLIHMPIQGLVLLIMGGVSYLLGVIFYVWKRLPFHHFLWHMFVMVGSLCHFGAMFYIHY